MMEDAIPLCIPEIRGNEWAYIRECLDTGWVSSVGAYVERFEQDVAREVGAGHGVSTTSGTAALHTALLVGGIRRDDEVLVSALTFVAPANAIRYVGAWPIFIDAEPDYWQMSPQRVAEFLREDCHVVDGELRNRQTGRRVRAILPVHILGHPVDMDPIMALAHEFGLVVVEDATESLGAQYRGRNVGSLGNMACFSFNGNKLITCGGGGMIVTDDEDSATRARYLTTQAKDDPIEFVHEAVGYNYRLTNLQAAMGCAQLEQLDDYVAAKRRIASTYGEALGSIPGLTAMPVAPWADSVSWMYTMSVDAALYGIDCRTLLERLGAQNIQVRPLWQPMHLSPAHRESVAMACPIAEELYSTALSLPCSVGLTRQQQRRVCDALRMEARAPQ